MIEQFEFQRRGSSFLIEQERAILGDEPGLGKTNQLLLAAQGKTLAIVPAMVLATWIEEKELWRPDLDLTLVSYSKLCDRGPDVRGRLTEVLPHPRPAFDCEWDTIISDESHYLKGRHTTWTHATECLSKKCRRFFLATGTPVPNWSYEIYMLLRLLHPGDRRFSNYWKWVERWFDIWHPPFGGTKVTDLQKRFSWEEFVIENELHTSMIRRTRETPEVVSEMGSRLPVSHQIIRVPMVPAQARLYKQLKKSYLAWTADSGEEISAWSDGDLHSKLSRIATGVEILGGEGKGSGKLDAVREMLKERRGNQIVLFCHYRATANALVDLCKKLGVDAHKVNQEVPQSRRDEIRRGFQAGDIECIIGSLGVITEGWTLTRADTCIFVEHSWRPSKNEGAVRRLDRIGQTRPVTAIHLVSEGTVDERMLKVLSKKNDNQVRLLRAHQFAQLL